jgi:hypothetical protein
MKVRIRQDLSDAEIDVLFQGASLNSFLQASKFWKADTYTIMSDEQHFCSTGSTGPLVFRVMSSSAPQSEFYLPVMVTEEVEE